MLGQTVVLFLIYLCQANANWNNEFMNKLYGNTCCNNQSVSCNCNCNCPQPQGFQAVGSAADNSSAYGFCYNPPNNAPNVTVVPYTIAQLAASSPHYMIGAAETVNSQVWDGVCLTYFNLGNSLYAVYFSVTYKNGTNTVFVLLTADLPGKPGKYFVTQDSTRLTIELGTHLDLTTFSVEVNNQGISYNIELGSHFTFMFLMGY